MEEQTPLFSPKPGLRIKTRFLLCLRSKKADMNFILTSLLNNVKEASYTETYSVAYKISGLLFPSQGMVILQYKDLSIFKT